MLGESFDREHRSLAQAMVPVFNRDTLQVRSPEVSVLKKSLSVLRHANPTCIARRCARESHASIEFPLPISIRSWSTAFEPLTVNLLIPLR
jgi:hypothetical protein